MADLLLELFSEEIPARMQAQAAKDLERLVVGSLSDRGLMFEGAKTFAGPRRLTLALMDLPAKQPDVSEEKKGPRTNAPAKAIDGFLRSAGLSLEQCEKRDDGKGEFYVAVVDRKGRATADVLAEVLPDCFAKLPWPKSMRWPQATETFGLLTEDGRSLTTEDGSRLVGERTTRWVRPLHSILCTFDGEVVPFTFAGVTSANHTRGHRFLSKGEVHVRRFDDYAKKLRDAHVILDADERREIILHDIKNKAFAIGCELIEDRGLLDEVTGLAEWPVVLIGTIENQFMELPAEILQTSMRTHQKYFSLRDLKTGKFANRFAFVAGMVTQDGGAQIVAGNERVLRARLSDAKFFWDQDRRRTLESRVNDLRNVVFHAKLGTQYERVERIEALAGEIAEKIGADVKKSKRAARLCKADLTTGVVGEFPELQGVMGGYYAEHDGEDDDVAIAVVEHYGPVGRNLTSQNPVTNSVAVSDKWDIISKFFKIGEKPTGSGDPYAIRRAALGMIKIILDRKYRLHLSQLPDFTDEVLSFIAERLKVALRESGVRHDLVDAVFSLGGEDDLVRLVTRVEALQAFLKTADGTNLLAGYKRAANILRIEEKKDGRKIEGEPDPELLSLPEEKALFMDIGAGRELITAELEHERFTDAMRAMARLRGPVDAFFDKVTVNATDGALRANRLKLLARLRDTLHTVADFSKIEG